MKFFSPRIPFLALLPSLLVSIPPQALGSKGREDRVVFIASVQGDVRISDGKDHHPDLNTPWQEALGGERVVEGSALATGNGRAEIEFENGSTVYLAENSLLLFKELRAPGDRVLSRMALATGRATFSMQPAIREFFFIDTPTAQMELSETEKFFVRVDAYLDATAVTAEGPNGQPVVWRDGRHLQLLKGKTMFFQDGEVIRPPARSTQAEALGMTPFLSTMPDFQLPALAFLYNRTNEMYPGPEDAQTQTASEWDAWVSSRVEQRNAVTATALKASGLSSPIPGLVDLYEQGRFFNCEPYGTCWEPTEPEAVEENSQQLPANRQSPAAAQANAFQPQTVHWRQFVGGWCDPGRSVVVTRVAHSPEELQKLLAMKDAIEHTSTGFHRYSVACDYGYWIRDRRHYVRVVNRRLPPGCGGGKCVVHHPRPVWVRVGNRIGFVPPHPNDVKGKPPVNLKEGILMPGSKPGERIERVALAPSQKVTVLDKAPREVPSEPVNQALHLSAPEIHAHLLQEAFPTRSPSLSARAVPQITYDYSHIIFSPPPLPLRSENPRESRWVASTPMARSGALPTATPALTLSRSLAARLSVPIEARPDRAIPAGDAIRATLLDRIRRDLTIRVPARTVAVLPTPRAPAVPAHRAVRAVARTAIRRNAFISSERATGFHHAAVEPPLGENHSCVADDLATIAGDIGRSCVFHQF